MKITFYIFMLLGDIFIWASGPNNKTRSAIFVLIFNIGAVLVSKMIF